eukprot:Polyplicarium_translucidae@DN1214_c0_g1_i1.p2
MSLEHAVRLLPLREKVALMEQTLSSIRADIETLEARALSLPIRRDPRDGPSRPLSAYMRFKRGRMRTIVADTALTAQQLEELARKVGAEWRGMSTEEREPFVRRANEDRGRHLREKADFERKRRCAPPPPPPECPPAGKRQCTQQPMIPPSPFLSAPQVPQHQFEFNSCRPPPPRHRQDYYRDYALHPRRLDY